MNHIATPIPSNRDNIEKPIIETKVSIISNSEPQPSIPISKDNFDELPIAYISSNRLFTNTDERPHASMTVSDSEHTMLLDSGSQITVVGINWIDRLQENWREKLKPSQFNIMTVDEKAKYVPVGVVDISYTYMGISRTIPIIVLSVDTRHPILGKTFLDAFNIDFAQRSANGWTSIPTFSVEANPSAKINVTNIERPAPIRTITANQFLSYLKYDESWDNPEICSVQTASEISELRSNLEFVAKMRENDQDDDVTPAKTACVNTPHNLTSEQRNMLESVLELFKHTSEIGELNRTSKIEHIIDTGIAVPVMRK